MGKPVDETARRNFRARAGFPMRPWVGLSKGKASTREAFEHSVCT